MAENGAQGQIAVVVVFEGAFRILTCDRHMTMAQVRQQWQNTTGSSISVAFFAQGNRHLSDDLTLEQALTDPSSVTLELRAFPKSQYYIQLYGWEFTHTLFEVAAILSPGDVRRDIGRAVEIYTDDFRLTYGDDELDQELPFNQQGLVEGAQLMVDLRVIMKVDFPDTNETKTLECHSSDSVGDLRQQLSLDDDIAIVSTSPYRRVLEDSLHVCHIVSEILDLEIPIHLIAERKVMLTFEPIGLENLQQTLPVALSCTPLDVYDLVSERFQLTTEFRLAVAGQELDNCKPLVDQVTGDDQIIQIDMVRPFLVSDMWKGLLEEDSFEQVFLYSTESSYALYLRDEINDQMLLFDDINLIMFGSVVDVFGPVTGTEKPMMLVDRDVQRNFPTLTFDKVTQRLGWARNMLIDVVSMTGGHLPTEIMRNGQILPGKSTLSELRLTEDTLMITNPDKIFISSDKRLSMHRFPNDATYGDVRERLQQKKGCLDIGLKTCDWDIPNEAKDRKLDRELLFLTAASRMQTKLTVTMNGQWFGCWFQPNQVSFTDVMINVGKQAKIMPRHLFSKQLYCCGCGRQVSKEEEPHQMIPATCCSVRSLQLTDRRMKDVGIQSAGARRRDVTTWTLYPHERDACVGTESTYRQTTVSAAPELRRAAASAPSLSMHVVVRSPEGRFESRTVTVAGGNCRALLPAADRQFAEVALGDSPMIFFEEVIYNRNGEERTALRCFDEKKRDIVFVDPQDGGLADESSWLRFSLRFLRPSSPLPSSPGLPRVISIRTEVEFFSAAPKGQLQAAPPEALTDSSVVALLWGVRSGAQFFWELSDSFRCVSAESDREFEREEIPGGPKRFVFALLRDKDPVPRARVPRDKTLRVHRRAGLELRVEKGCVRCAGRAPLTDTDLWDFFVDAFLRDFAAAARK